MRVVVSKPRSNKSFFPLAQPINPPPKKKKKKKNYLPHISFKTLRGTKMPFIVAHRFSRGCKTFNAKLTSTINRQIHGIQNLLRPLNLGCH